jgi:hypothetical protein
VVEQFQSASFICERSAGISAAGRTCSVSGVIGVMTSRSRPHPRGPRRSRLYKRGGPAASGHRQRRAVAAAGSGPAASAPAVPGNPPATAITRTYTPVPQAGSTALASGQRDQFPSCFAGGECLGSPGYGEWLRRISSSLSPGWVSPEWVRPRGWVICLILVSRRIMSGASVPSGIRAGWPPRPRPLPHARGRWLGRRRPGRGVRPGQHKDDVMREHLAQFLAADRTREWRSSAGLMRR